MIVAEPEERAVDVVAPARAMRSTTGGPAQDRHHSPFVRPATTSAIVVERRRARRGRFRRTRRPRRRRRLPCSRTDRPATGEPDTADVGSRRRRAARDPTHRPAPGSARWRRRRDRTQSAACSRTRADRDRRSGSSVPVARASASACWRASPSSSPMRAAKPNRNARRQRCVAAASPPAQAGHLRRGLQVERLVEHERGVEVGLEAGEQRRRPVRSRLPDELAVVGRGDGAEQGQPGAHVGATADRHATQAEAVAVGVARRRAATGRCGGRR